MSRLLARRCLDSRMIYVCSCTFSYACVCVRACQCIVLFVVCWFLCVSFFVFVFVSTKEKKECQEEKKECQVEKQWLFGGGKKVEIVESFKLTFANQYIIVD